MTNHMTKNGLPRRLKKDGSYFELRGPYTMKARPCRTCGASFVPSGTRAYYCTAACYITAKTVPGPNGCIDWIGKTRGYGYGVFTHDERVTVAHRAAWEIAYGPIPEGMVVRHKCDRPICCNPEHLTIGTQAQNVQDCVRRGRRRTFGQKPGDDHPMAKLNTVKAAAIRAAYRDGAGRSQASLAKEYGVCQRTISAVILGRIWKEKSPPREEAGLSLPICLAW